MADFLHRRASLLIEEARTLADGQVGREACQRVLATCEFLKEGFGRYHRELPDLFELLGNMYFSLGDEASAAKYQIHAWELAHSRSRRIGRLLAASRLPADTQMSKVDGDGIDPATSARFWVESIRHGGALESAPEILVFGPPRSGKSRIIQTIGHLALDHCWKVRYFRGYELLERLRRDDRNLSLHQGLKRLDTYTVLLVDDFDPWRMDAESSELLRALLLHRKARRASVITVPMSVSGDNAKDFARLAHAESLRSLDERTVFLVAAPEQSPFR